MNQGPNQDHDDLTGRISCWLSGEIDQAAAGSLDREVRRDPAAQRIAAGFRRVDALARDWYDALPVEPERKLVAPPPVARPSRSRGLAAALAGCVVVACSWQIDPAAALAGLTRAAAAAISSAGGSPPRREPAAYWNLRQVALDWTLPVGLRAREPGPRGS